VAAILQAEVVTPGYRAVTETFRIAQEAKKFSRLMDA
jgi:hypothetical protein